MYDSTHKKSDTLEARVIKPPNNDIVVAFRNKDLLALAAHPAVGMLPLEYHRFQRFFRSQIFATNPPIHGPMRQVFARPLAPKQLVSLNESAKRIATDLVNELIGRGQIEFNTQFIDRYIARFWGTVFEMTAEEMEQLPESVRPLTEAALVTSTPNENDSLDLFDKYIDLVSRSIHRSLERGGSPLLRSMADLFDVVEGEAKPQQVSEMIAVNAIDGVHTAAVACSNVLYQLLASPNDLSTLRANLDLTSNAVREGLRLYPPLIELSRYALQDLEFAETFIPRGTAISMLWAAGNRDPEVFENPNRYDLFRKRRAETTFGGGAHICPGRFTARMLVQTMLEIVLAPNVLIELTDDSPKWLATSFSRQLDRIPVSVSHCRS